MVEKLKSWLRGNYNSIRYRFLVLPREWLTYSWYRMTGRSWIDFYSQRLDRFSAAQNAAPPERYMVQVEDHIQFLLKKGLTPDHRLLDYGCGVLRTGLLLIPYLKPGKYVGVEISQGRLQRGIDLATERGIPRDRYTTHLVSDCRLKEIGDDKFDIIWAKSVMTHMPANDIRAVLDALRGHFAPGGRFFFTFNESDELKRMYIKDFYYSRDYLRTLAGEHGYSFEIDHDWDSDRLLDVMACVRPVG